MQLFWTREISEYSKCGKYVICVGIYAQGHVLIAKIRNYKELFLPRRRVRSLIFGWRCRDERHGSYRLDGIIPARFHSRGPHTCSLVRAHTRITVSKSRVSRWITAQRRNATRRKATRCDTTYSHVWEVPWRGGGGGRRRKRVVEPVAFRGRESRLNAAPMTMTATTTTLSGWSWRRHEAVALYDCKTGCNGAGGSGPVGLGRNARGMCERGCVPPLCTRHWVMSLSTLVDSNRSLVLHDRIGCTLFVL